MAPWRGPLCCASVCLAAAPAFAHTSERGYVLLLPTGHYLAGGAAAVAASFVVLALMPPTLVARGAAARLVLAGTATGGRMRGGRTIVSLAGFAVFAFLVYCGLAGSRDPLSNPLPLVFWTLVWAGLTAVQGLVGDVWSWVNPWYGPARLFAHLSRRDPARPPLRLPEQAGYWPALVLFFGLAWFELIDIAPDDPGRLAIAAAVYYVANLVAMLSFGHAEWSRRGECISAFFSLIARYAIIGRLGEARKLAIGLPGARLLAAPALPPSGVLFLLLTLASVSFDGLSRTFFWLGMNGVNPLEFPGRSAMVGVNTIGLVLTFAVLAAAFLLCVLAGERLARSTQGFAHSAGLFVWSIVPIALAYHFAHYLVVFLVNGQYALVALSDPLGLGWDLFGTADWQVSPGVTLGADAAWLIWNLQAGAIILGHLLAVLAAHLIAWRLHREPARASLSQLPLTVLMVLYTVFGLWLLSTPTGA